LRHFYLQALRVSIAAHGLQHFPESLMHALESWKEEKRSVYLYRIVAETEAGTPRRALFLELAEAAERQAGLWAVEIVKADGSVPADYHPDLRTRIVAVLVQRFGARAMRPVLAAAKVRGMSIYAKSAPHAMPQHLSDVGRSHKSTGGGNLRAAVFGMNDGLVSNASLIMGIAGASAEPGVIVLTGVAGLLAGAFSMAAGEYVSVRSQREMYEYQIGLERAELEEYPQEEAAELALIYEAKGISREEAKRLADTLIADPERAMDALTREELGLNPDELGSPWGAAFFSFCSFALGAAIPLAPFLLSSGSSNLPVSIGFTALALFAVGATLSLFSGRGALKGGLRMLLIGAAAGGATYLIGKMIGVGLM